MTERNIRTVYVGDAGDDATVDEICEGKFQLLRANVYVMTSCNNCIPTCHEYLAKVTRRSFSPRPEEEQLARETTYIRTYVIVHTGHTKYGKPYICTLTVSEENSIQTFVPNVVCCTTVSCIHVLNLWAGCQLLFSLLRGTWLM